MDWIIDLEIWASLLTLTALEIVLGIDNLLFIAILAGRLPAEQQNRARQIGLALALLNSPCIACLHRLDYRPHPAFVRPLRPACFLAGHGFDRRWSFPSLQGHARDPSRPGRRWGRGE